MVGKTVAVHLRNESSNTINNEQYSYAVVNHLVNDDQISKVIISILDKWLNVQNVNT